MTVAFLPPTRRKPRGPRGPHSQQTISSNVATTLGPTSDWRRKKGAPFLSFSSKPVNKPQAPAAPSPSPSPSLPWAYPRCHHSKMFSSNFATNNRNPEIKKLQFAGLHNRNRDCCFLQRARREQKALEATTPQKTLPILQRVIVIPNPEICNSLDFIIGIVTVVDLTGDRKETRGPRDHPSKNHRGHHSKQQNTSISQISKHPNIKKQWPSK